MSQSIGSHDATSDRRLLAAGTIALLAYLLIVLPWRSDMLFIGGDGDCSRVFARHLFRLASSPIDLSVINPYQGMGSLLPPWAVWINPSWLPFYFFADEQWASVVSYLVVILAVAASTYWLGRSLGLSPLPTLFAAQLAAVACFPPVLTIYYHELSLGHIFGMGGPNGWIVSLGAVWVGALIHAGSPGWRGRLAMASLPLIALYCLLCDPLWATVLMAPIALPAGCLVLGADGDRRWRRLIAAVVMIAVVTACGVPPYLWALSQYTARVMFADEVFAGNPDYGTFFFQGPLPVAVSVAIGASCLVAIVWGTRDQRWFGASVLVAMLVLNGLMAAHVRWHVLHNYPDPGYMENGLLPVYAVGLASGMSVLSRRRRAGVSMEKPVAEQPRHVSSRRIARLIAAIAVPLWGLGMVWLADYFGERPLPQGRLRHGGEIAQRLRRELSLADGRAFRGSVAFLVGIPGGDMARVFRFPDEGPTTDEHLEMADVLMRKLYPGAHQTALWRQRIPTLDDFNQIASPPMYYFLSRTMSRPEDQYGASSLGITRLRPTLARLIGVRFVLADRPLEDPQLKLCAEEPRRFVRPVVLRLYELDDPNVGQYSPTELLMARDAADAVRRLCAADFLPTKQVVLTEPLAAGQLVPAERAAMRFERGGVRVEASSRGRSLIILPLQFSRALRMSIIGGPTDPPPRLFRANLVQTGILFSGTITVKLQHRFGPLRGLRGRMQDLDDCRRLGLTSVERDKEVVATR